MLLLVDVFVVVLVEFVFGFSDFIVFVYVLFILGLIGEFKGVEVVYDVVMNIVEIFIWYFELGVVDCWFVLVMLECDMLVLDIFVVLCFGGVIVVVDEVQCCDFDVWVWFIDIYEVMVLNFMLGWLDMLFEVGGGWLLLL